MAANVFDNATVNGYRTQRLGDVVLVTMQGAVFATTVKEHMAAMQWARARPSIGNFERDRIAYCSQHQVLLARRGGGVATSGPRKQLAQIVKTLQDNNVALTDWVIPQDVYPELAALGGHQQAAANPPAENQ